MAIAGETWQQGPGLLASMWRMRYVVVAVTLVFGGLGYILSASQSPTYEATARLFLSDPRYRGIFSESARVDPLEYIEQQAARAQARPVYEQAAEQFPELSTAALSRRVAVIPDPTSLALHIEAAAGEPERAAEYANAMAAAYESVALERAERSAEAGIESLQLAREDLQAQLDAAEQTLGATPDDLVAQARVETLTSQLTELEARAQQLAVDVAVSGTGVDTVELAEPPDDPSGPAPVRDAIIAAVLGLAIAGAFAYWWVGRDKRVEDRTLPGRILDAPLLGEIPEFATSGDRGAASALSVAPAAAEAYQFLVTSIRYALAERGGRSIVISSPGAGNGKTTAALQVSFAANRHGSNVLLIDGDVRRHGLSRAVSLQDRVGFADVVAGTAVPAAAEVRLRVSDDTVMSLVPAGRRPSDPGSLLRSEGVREAVESLVQDREFVVVDTPPLLAVADATTLAGFVDGIVLVVDRGTPVGQLEKLRERLAFTNTPLLGYVYNRAKTDASSPYEYDDRERPGWSARTLESVTSVTRDRGRTQKAGAPERMLDAERR